MGRLFFSRYLLREMLEKIGRSRLAGNAGEFRRRCSNLPANLIAGRQRAVQGSLKGTLKEPPRQFLDFAGDWASVEV